MKTKQTFKRDFIIFGEDFQRHPHALEHLLRPLFGQSRFIWVETIGLRSPKFRIYDFYRAVEKIYRWILCLGHQSSAHSSADFFVVRPLMIPFNQYKLVRKLNFWSVLFTVRRALRKHDFSKIITVASVPNAADYVGAFNERLKIYFCVDEFALWPGIDFNLARIFETKLIENCDYVFATSKALVQAKFKNGKETRLLTHGVEYEHFNIGTKKDPGHQFKVCYFGLFDERTDQKILSDLATELPDIEIHIFGKVVCDIFDLSFLKNIIFHGPVSYAKLPQCLTDMDVFILPYMQNELTLNINPLKLKEYLATERPIIATPLPEVMVWKDHLLIGETGHDFSRLITQLRSGVKSWNSSGTQKLLKKTETWKAKSEEFINALEVLENR